MYNSDFTHATGGLNSSIKDVVTNFLTEMTNYQQWVCWRWGEQDPNTGKSRKIPVNPWTGKNANVSAPQTWGTFEKALEAVELYPCNGIGFMLDKNDEFVALDLDNCLSGDTQEVIEIKNRLDTYTERSPSKNGLRLIAKGTMPCWSKNRYNNMEAYDCKRFVTITGDIYGEAKPIRECQDEIEWFCYNYIGSKTQEKEKFESCNVSTWKLSEKEKEIRIAAARNDRKLVNLMNGNTSNYPSPSEAEFAMLSKLHFYLGPDANLIEETAYKSKLVRDKWERKDGVYGTYLRRTIQRVISQNTDIYQPPPKEVDQHSCTNDLWSNAKQIAPRIEFPWDVLPPELSDSLNALAQSCATSAEPLPGYAMAMLASAVGRTLKISPKESWEEPLIFWFMDVRPSGEGKTPAMWNLANCLKEIQEKEQSRYVQEYRAWKKQKKSQDEPPPRGYYLTDLTLEGLRNELEDHPTGGIIALLNEISSLINGQNQYKQNGTDREAWLALHDGQPARIVRANKNYYIRGARVQVVGGIQPEVFQRIFGGQNGQYIADGTVYRCLPVYISPQYNSLTRQGWSDSQREIWENILKRAYHWADKQKNTEHTVQLTKQAQDLFIEWRNNLDCQKHDFPKIIKGFLPKIYGHALRLAAVIDCLHYIPIQDSPRLMLDAEGMERGIKAAMYYLRQAIDVSLLLVAGDQEPDPNQAKILDALRNNGSMSASEIATKTFKKNKKSDDIKSALNILLKAGQITTYTEATSGRPRTLYSLNTCKNANVVADEVEI